MAINMNNGITTENGILKNIMNSGIVAFIKKLFTKTCDSSANAKQMHEEKNVFKSGAKCPVASQSKTVGNTRFQLGQIVTATVQRIDVGGLYFKVPSARTAVLSAKTFGIDQVDREKKMRNFKVGDKIRAKIKAWYPENGQLVFSGITGRIGENDEKRTDGRAADKTVNVNVVRPKTGKPDYQVISKDSTILVDGANILGAFEPEEAADVLKSLSDGLRNLGYESRIYLERRSMNYYSFNQENDASSRDFEAVCKDLDVTVVVWESDLVILQALKAVPNSTGITKDRLADYEKAFPELVGSKRLRSFSVSRIDGKTLIMIDGLTDAITVEKHAVESVEKETPVESVAPRMFTNNAKRGLYGFGNTLFENGNMPAATRCYNRVVAGRHPEGFEGLAEIYACSGDAKKAAKCEKLGEELRRRLREQKRRGLRRAAERRRATGRCQRKSA